MTTPSQPTNSSDPLFQAMLSAGGASSSATSTSASGVSGSNGVFVGFYPDTKYQNGAPKIVSVTDATNEFYSWDDTQLNKFRNQLELAGYNTSKMDRIQLSDAWKSLVTESSKYTNAGQLVSPTDILNSDATARQGQVAPGGGTTSSAGKSSKGSAAIQGTLPQEITRTSAIVNYTDPNTARAIMNQTMTNLLGRNPTNSEIKKFTDALHDYEKANPQVSRMTIDSTTGMVTKDDSVDKRITTPGMQQMAEDQAKATKEYGSYQAATTYFNALKAMAGQGASPTNAG